MLIEFRAENHRSIREEQVLTMEAGRSSDTEAPHVRLVEGYRTPLVTAAGIYGANASGKSNLLSAMAYMRGVVLQSHRFWNPDGGVPRSPFAWGEYRSKPSLYEATFIEEQVRYRFGFAVDDNAVVEEWLHAWPHGRQQVWYERDRDQIKIGENLKGENRIIEEITRPNALFLSAAAQLRHEQLMTVYRWFSRTQTVGPDHRMRMLRRTFRRATPSQQPVIPFLDDAEQVEDDNSMASQILALLKAADLGILDFKYSRDPERRDNESLYFLHEAESSNAWLPLEEESEGTQALLELAYPVITALARGRLLLLDELERSMHPMLAMHVLRQFNEPTTNPKNAQLLFTTHDTNLLGTSAEPVALARDQVWLTEKNRSGATVVYPLTDYKPRKHENLERGYLQGRYGAIPFLAPLVEDEDE
jgi:AAA15 family ATPase/GTPase